MSVIIETTLGDITVDLYLAQRPRACLNFLKLCKLKYYNFNLFHTISRGFIAQTGDPTGTRTGGESVFGVIEGSTKRYFEAENEPRIKHTRPGLISFVGGEDNMIGSQFFVSLGEDLTYLDEKHCVFGEVVEGVDILEAINEVICDKDDRPYQDVRITHTVVLDDPCPDPDGLIVPARSPSPNAARLAGGRIAPDEEIDETCGRSAQEVAELQADREAKARATILEMVGDIPDAEMAPPENVLFVCKLNPVTTDDDLEIIFSRFGKIKSCEVIRDRKTGDSLQYAFIEFEGQKSCEDAYFKMGNVLIDDRRIHVDFSQSVSKVKWLGKGRGVAHYDEKGNKRRADAQNDVGKGYYKVTNGVKEESRDRRRETRSPVRDNSSRRPKRLSRSPERNKRKSLSVERQSRNRNLVEQRKNRSPSPIKTKRKSSSPLPKRRRSRSAENVPTRNDKRLYYRRHSKSPRRTSSRNYRSPNRSRRKSSPRRRSRSPRRVRNSHQSYSKRSWSPKVIRRDISRDRSTSIARYKQTNRYRSATEDERSIHSRNIKSDQVQKLDKNQERTSKRLQSPKPRSTSPLNEVQRGSSTSQKEDATSSSRSRKMVNEELINSKSKVRNEGYKETRESITKRTKRSKRKKSKSSNSSAESESESEDDRPKKKKHKKKVESSTDSSSSSESDTSSEEEKLKSKSKKRYGKKDAKVKKKKKTNRKKKHASSSESSTSSSEGSPSESSSSNSSSESDSKNKKKVKKKKNKSSSESD